MLTQTEGGRGEEPGAARAVTQRYAEDQALLNHARYLWLRFVREERSYLDESAEQLRSLSYLSVLVAGFVLVAFLQFGFDPNAVDPGLLVTFALTNSLTVALNLGCMLSASFMLACGFKTFTGFLTDEHQAEFIQSCVRFARRYKPGARPPRPAHSFREHWERVTAIEWRLLLVLFGVGLLAFLANLACAAFIKFQDNLTPAILLTAPLGLGALYLYTAAAKWLHALFSRKASLKAVDASWDPVGLPFDWHLPPRGGRDPLQGKLQHALSHISFKPRAGSGRHLLAGAARPLGAAWASPRGTPPRASPPAAAARSTATTPAQRASPLWGPQEQPSPGGSQAGRGPAGDAEPWQREWWTYASLQQARQLWLRHVQRNRVDMEERAEQVRSFAFLAGILGGFGVASVLQLNFDAGATNDALQLGFAISVGLAVGLGVAAMVMHSLVLLAVLAAAPALVAPAEEAPFMAACRRFALEYRPGGSPPAPQRTFRKYWAAHCSAEFVRAFYFFISGLLCLMANLVFGAWIKYGPGQAPAALSATLVLSLGLLFQLFTMVRWVPFLLRGPGPGTGAKIREAEPLGLPLDWFRAPRST